MLQFISRLPTLRFHLHTLSRSQFVKFLSIIKRTHSIDASQMDGEGSSSSMAVYASRQDKAAIKLAQCTHGSDSDSELEVESDGELTVHWRCQTIEAVHRGLQPFELEHLGPVQPGGQHRVLYRHPIRNAANEPPRPYRAPHRWDAEHVRLPCAPESKYPVEAADGSSEIESRWEMIERALLRPISNSKELQAAILSYNTTYKGQWSFHALHKLFNVELDESESRVFFEDLLPRIIRLALRLPELIQAPIPLLKQNQTSALTLSQQQISCLLANAFLCTYPRRNTLKRKSEYSSFPDINFNRLFQTTGSSVMEKLKCFFHYFRRVCPTERDASNVPTGCVTFMRVSGKPEQQVNWNLSGAAMSAMPIHINAGGTIEDQGAGLLQVDFANKYLGGGVLGQGCVQEEIRFVICPELCVSKLFTECLQPTEALLMVGSERYSNYTGYAGSFVWAGNHEDSTPCDSSRRRRTAIVAIDALHFTKNSTITQYSEELILRELNKASIGFKHWLSTPAPGVATGNWGCGAFGGDPHLKALIQMMVCAHHERPLAYFTFGNRQLRDNLHALWQLFRVQGTTVQQLWSVLRRFKKDGGSSKSLYQFVLKEIKQTQKKQTEAATTSPDLFADCSDTSGNGISQTDDDDDVQEVDAVDDDNDEEQEQTNAMMLAASLESAAGNSNSNTSSSSSSTVSGSNNNSAKSNKSNAISSSGRATGTRQLTLVEMLDKHYDLGQANASKRQRQSTNAEKCGKARKDCSEGDAGGGGNSCAP